MNQNHIAIVSLLTLTASLLPSLAQPNSTTSSIDQFIDAAVDPDCVQAVNRAFSQSKIRFVPDSNAPLVKVGSDFAVVIRSGKKYLIELEQAAPAGSTITEPAAIETSCYIKRSGKWVLINRSLAIEPVSNSG